MPPIPLAPRQLLRFGVVGVLSNGVYVLVLVLLRAAAIPWWLAAALAYAVSMVVNYVAQRTFTFRSDRPHGAAAVRYVMLILSCLALNATLMELLIQRVRLHPVVAQLISLALVTTLSYFGQKRWVFAGGRRVE